MNKSKSSVTVVIPNYNGEKLLAKYLPNVVAAFKNPKNNIVEIIVADDASTDSSIEIIRNQFPEVKIVRSKVNNRFSANVNLGVKSAKGDFILLLNTDVSPQKNVLECVLPLFEDKTVFGVSLAEEGYSWARGYFSNGFVEHSPGEGKKYTHSTFWISGGSGVFRKSMWNRLGGLDQVLFPPFYWEDIDISYRAMKRGWKLLWEPKAIVYHEHESTNKSFDLKYKSRIEERNQLLFIWKNITSRRMIRKHMLGLLKRIVFHPGYLRIFLMAIIKIRLVFRLRKIEIKESTVSDESIFARI